MGLAWRWLLATMLALSVTATATTAEWRAPFEVPVSGALVASPSVAVAADGRAAVAWVRGGGTGIAVQRLAVDGSPTGAPQVVVLDQAVNFAEAGMADDGTIVLVWQPADPGLPAQHARVDAAGTVIGQRPIIPTGTRADLLRIVVAADGTGLLVWRPVGSTQLLARTVALSGAAGEVRLLEEQFDGATPPEVAIGPRGAVVVWGVELPGMAVRFARLSSAGELALTPITVADEAVEGTVGLSTDGTATVAWSTQGAGRIQLRRVHVSGAMGPVRDLSQVADQARAPRLAVAPDGRSVAVWRVVTPFGLRAEARRLDGNDILGTIQQLPGSGASFTEALVAFPARGPALLVASTQEQVPPLGRAEAFAFLDDDRIGASEPLGPQMPGLFGPQLLAASPSGAAVTAWRGSGDAGDRLFIATRAPITVAPPPGSPGAGQTPAPTGAPRLSAVAVRPGRAVIRAATRPSPRVSFTLDRSAVVRVVVTRIERGIRRGARCVARVGAPGRGRSCVRVVTVGTLTRTAAAGRGQVVVRGLRIGRRVLIPGRYRFAITAVAAGERSRVVSRNLVVVRAVR